MEKLNKVKASTAGKYTKSYFRFQFVIKQLDYLYDYTDNNKTSPLGSSLFSGIG